MLIAAMYLVSEWDWLREESLLDVDLDHSEPRCALHGSLRAPAPKTQTLELTLWFGELKVSFCCARKSKARVLPGGIKLKPPSLFLFMT